MNLQYSFSTNQNSASLYYGALEKVEAMGLEPLILQL